MKALLAAPAAALVALWGPLPARAPADPGNATPPSPPYVDHTQWAQWNGLPSLRVYPTRSGRLASRMEAAGTAVSPATAQASAAEAWAEVLALAPDADTPGMRAQFVCHWRFAELAQPGKASWNLEPWRPVVDDAEMVAAGCNPGGDEEAL
jgi:hypothetical protein